MRAPIATMGMVVAAAWVSPGGAAGLAPQQAALVGAWSAPSARGIAGLRLQPVADSDGCLRYSGAPGLDIEDHPSLGRGTFWRVHRLAPGRWALAGVLWGYLSAGNFIYFGLSPEPGEAWTFDVAPGAVTDIGVWRVRRMAQNAFVVETGSTEGTRAEAAARAGAGSPVLLAEPVRRRVAAKTGPCPAGQAPFSNGRPAN